MSSLLDILRKTRSDENDMLMVGVETDWMSTSALPPSGVRFHAENISNEKIFLNESDEVELEARGLLMKW